MSESGATGTATARWNATALQGALDAAGALLERHAAAIDALNVFPVPDGDTGKNMLLTMQTALEAGRQEGAGPGEAGAGALAARVARGALMGSRGNSGVILSQILRGFARGLDGAAEVDAPLLARALREATTTAYRAVQQPVEGTMLTVIREAAEGAERAAQAEADLIGVLDAALAAARDALARTPELLPLLREAGVVDAGGQGVVSLLEGICHFARGEPLPGGEELAVEATPGQRMIDFLEEHEEDEVGYCTNLMILARPGDRLDFPLVRERILALGESGVVIGDEELVKIHIHTEHPGAVLEEGVRWGELTQIRIDNMAAQVRAVTEAAAASTGRRPTPTADTPADAAATPMPAPSVDLAAEAPAPGPQIVAVASGDGLAEVLRGLGAAKIVPGGQTMNPSTEELLRAVEELPGDEVILLPNNANVILTARQVVGLSDKRVAVVPSRSAPQGIAALSAFNFDADLDANAAAMAEVLAAVHTGEITRAVRDATIEGVEVAEGQVIGLIDDRLCCSGPDETDVLLDLLDRMDAAGAELITLYSGEEVDEATAGRVVESLQSRYPDATVELVDGGQPHYHYLVSVE